MSILSLNHWRREIFSIYSEVRSETNGRLAWGKWKEKREALFREHPESPTFNSNNKLGLNDTPIFEIFLKYFTAQLVRAVIRHERPTGSISTVRIST